MCFGFVFVTQKKIFRRKEAVIILDMLKKFVKSRLQACVLLVIAAVMVIVFIFVRNSFFTGEQYIIGEIVSINSGTAQMDNFDKNDGSYTGDGELLYIRFEPDDCEFLDEDGKAIEATDITVGSKVKMTASTGLKTDKYGYTTVYIKKVEVLEMAYLD